MSAAGRGKRLDDSGLDYYSTPAWCSEALLPFLPAPPGLVLEPCCGTGAISSVLRHHGYRVVEGDVEVRPRQGTLLLEPPDPKVELVDATDPAAVLDRYGDQAPTCVVTNPPYRHAFEVVRTFVGEFACPQWYLLRLGWLAGLERAPWLVRNVPGCVLVLSRRPSFSGGATDSADYAWIGWNVGPDVPPIAFTGTASRSMAPGAVKRRLSLLAGKTRPL